MSGFQIIGNKVFANQKKCCLFNVQEKIKWKSTGKQIKNQSFVMKTLGWVIKCQIQSIDKVSDDIVLVERPLQKEDLKQLTLSLIDSKSIENLREIILDNKLLDCKDEQPSRDASLPV
eukprot:TRINITY_DN5913_c0_g2_i2.p2 TRINITY_DN5913_c0_g2~~TRINITY_DN5913_c0_g2_i2.p2  ORF type:complete len:118 (-),score=7.07 TRINITY_DN5913_c0_g2_i2:21-374(-)